MDSYIKCHHFPRTQWIYEFQALSLIRISLNIFTYHLFLFFIAHSLGSVVRGSLFLFYLYLSPPLWAPHPFSSSPFFAAFWLPSPFHCRGSTCGSLHKIPLWYCEISHYLQLLWMYCFYKYLYWFHTLYIPVWYTQCIQFVFTRYIKSLLSLLKISPYMCCSI